MHRACSDRTADRSKTRPLRMAHPCVGGSRTRLGGRGCSECRTSTRCGTRRRHSARWPRDGARARHGLPRDAAAEPGSASGRGRCAGAAAAGAVGSERTTAKQRITAGGCAGAARGGLRVGITWCSSTCASGAAGAPKSTCRFHRGRKTDFFEVSSSGERRKAWLFLMRLMQGVRSHLLGALQPRSRRCGGCSSRAAPCDARPDGERPSTFLTPIPRRSPAAKASEQPALRPRDESRPSAAAPGARRGRRSPPLPGSQPRLTTSGELSASHRRCGRWRRSCSRSWASYGRLSVNSSRKAAFTNSGAPRMYETHYDRLLPGGAL